MNNIKTDKLSNKNPQSTFKLFKLNHEKNLIEIIFFSKIILLIKPIVLNQVIAILKIAKIFTPDLPNRCPNVKIIKLVIKGRKIDKIYMCFYKLLPPHQ